VGDNANLANNHAFQTGKARSIFSYCTISNYNLQFLYIGTIENKMMNRGSLYALEKKAF